MNTPGLMQQILMYISLAKNRQMLIELVREGRLELDWRKIAYLTGMIGIAIIVLSTFSAAFAFNGPNGSAYSMLNHKISTLGKPQFSNWAILFNWGLRIGGVCLMGFIMALGLYVGRRTMLIVTVAGLVMATGVVLVGVCPVTEPQCHKVAAQLTFVSGLAATLSFTFILLLSAPEKLSKWLTLPSAIASLSFFSFIIIMYTQYDNPQEVFIKGPLGAERPYLWLPSLLEWLVFGTVVTWLVTIVVYLFWQERAERPQKPG